MERFKALAAKWHSDAAETLRHSEAISDPIESLTRFAIGRMHQLCAKELDNAILATENEAFMESIVPGFKDLDDVVATDAANSVIL